MYNRTSAYNGRGGLLPNSERALIGCAGPSSKGVGVPHQCSRVNEQRSGLGGSRHWPADSRERSAQYLKNEDVMCDDVSNISANQHAADSRVCSCKRTLMLGQSMSQQCPRVNQTNKWTGGGATVPACSLFHPNSCGNAFSA